MSAPATKARPAPVRIAPPTSSRCRTSSIASPSSPIVAAFSAFSLSGRFTVIVAIRSATDSSIEAYGIRGNGRREVGSTAPRAGPGGEFKCKDVDLNLPWTASYE